MSKLKYIQNINEFNSLNDDELLLMSNITGDESGIENVIIWVGANKHEIKISNTLKYDGKDCFIMTIPDFKIIGNVNSELISTDKINQIKLFIEKNLNIIISYSNFEIPTDILFNKIIPI